MSTGNNFVAYANGENEDALIYTVKTANLKRFMKASHF